MGKSKKTIAPCFELLDIKTAKRDGQCYIDFDFKINRYHKEIINWMGCKEFSKLLGNFVKKAISQVEARA